MLQQSIQSTHRVIKSLDKISQLPHFKNIFIFFAGEIARQLIDSDAKFVFGGNFMSKTFEEAVELTKRPIKVIYVEESENESIPRGGIDFKELSEVGNLDLSLLREFERDVNKTAVLPYSR